MKSLIETAIDNGQKLYKQFNNPQVLSLLSNCELKWINKQKTSLEIVTNNLKDPNDLIDLFRLEVDMFKGKFIQAISGRGHEYKEIRRLHSSSLVALLCFYNVSALNPLECSIETERVVFSESLFEIQNPIPNSKKPSNIDIVLKGKNIKSGRKVTLYLESKFSEYLKHGEKDKISTPVYKEIYRQLKKSLDSIDVSFDEYSDNYSKLKYQNKQNTHYLEGVKQIISHYLGVHSVATQTRATDEDIFLGEILFRFCDEEIDNNCEKIVDYISVYEKMAEGLNKYCLNFRVVNSCFTYQDLFKSFNLDPAVRLFYSL